MSEDRIEGFVAGLVAITVANSGHAVSLAMGLRRTDLTEATITVEQSARLRRLLAAAEKRARTRP